MATWGWLALTVKVIPAVGVDDRLIAAAGLRDLPQPGHGVPRERQAVQLHAVDLRGLAGEVAHTLDIIVAPSRGSHVADRGVGLVVPHKRCPAWRVVRSQVLLQPPLTRIAHAHTVQQDLVPKLRSNLLRFDLLEMRFVRRSCALGLTDRSTGISAARLESSRVV